MKVLIIGAAGFVGGHLVEYLNLQPEVEVFASKLVSENFDIQYMPGVNINGVNILNLDLLNRKEAEQCIKAISPDYIINLAGQSSVSLSWKEPAATIEINLVGTVNLLEAIKKAGSKARTLIIGSAEEYGYIKPEDLPIKESTPISPKSPYAISKSSQEMISSLYVETYNMEIIMVRAFNHIGPRQSPAFAIPDFARQIAEIEKGIKEPVLSVGNLSAKRDFTDVRDIARGYWDLVCNGTKGEIYNIGSGKSYSIQDLLNRMLSMSSRKIEVMADKNKFRPTDIPELRADISKICSHVNWKPEINIDITLKDILDYWRAKC